MCVVRHLRLPAIPAQARIQGIHGIAGVLYEADMEDVELFWVTEAAELADKVIEDQHKALVVLHYCHLRSAHDEGAQTKIKLEHRAVGFGVVAVKIDMVQLHDFVFPSVRRTRAGRNLDSDDRPRTRPILVVSGHGQERVYSLKRDCLRRDHRLSPYLYRCLFRRE